MFTSNCRERQGGYNYFLVCWRIIFSKLLSIYVILKLVWTKFFTKKSDSSACLIGKTAIVTGGNSGIGYETSLLLASRGCRVIIACRRDCQAEMKRITEITGNENIYHEKLDLAFLEEVRNFCENIKKREKKIDILVNNAGIGATKQRKTIDDLNPIMQTNHFGPFLLTHLLIEQLRAAGNARIVFVSSCLAFAHNLDKIEITDNDKRSREVAYSNAKLCNILSAQEFSARLKKYGINTYSADPGVSKTPIFKEAGEILREKNAFTNFMMGLGLFIFSKDPVDAAQTVFHLASSEKLKHETGEHYCLCERFSKPSILSDRNFCDKVWRQSEEAVGLRDNEKLLLIDSNTE